MDVYSNVSCIKGVGPKTKKVLEDCSIYTIMDLLLYFPRDYKEYNSCNNFNEGKDKEEVIVACKAIDIKKDIRIPGGKTITTIIFTDGNNNIKCKWFNQPYIKNSFMLNNEYVLKGKINIYKNEKMLTNPKVLKEQLWGNEKNIEPVYPLRNGITNSTFIKLINEILKKVEIEENLPEWIIDKHKFISLNEAIRNIHYPKDKSALFESKKRLKYQELFTYSLKIAMLKNMRNTSKGISFNISDSLKNLKEKLPFQLTEAQNRAVREILIDQKKPVVMNRLVQGDVGSGKTVVGIISAFNIIMNGYQVAFMAPTEILANQHFEEANKILEGFNINIKLLCGSISAKEKEAIKRDLKEGKIHMIIGTHALLEDDVEFDNLGFIITDEQHRFGVMQRSKLINKGENPDTLVMTATPIPRTLALYLYGDLEVSIIDQLPPGRQKIDTYFIKSSEKNRAYSFAIKEIKEGRQVYIVCPLVEENENLELTSVEYLHEELNNKYFKDIPTAILHGKMPSKEKNNIMNKFKNGEIKILIATTVIEVGVNIPNATLMIVENAERFGLAQLHQLRGRVGRGSKKSYCILIGEVKNHITKKRMETMVKSNDGFFIADQDFKLRGSGEIFGFKQHGTEEFLLCNIVEDIEAFKLAHEDAKLIWKSENLLDKNIIKYIMKRLETNTRYICFN
ncbi:ATP-dependent DNA helicase RecG [Clostridium sp. MSJ-11]|uniref:ATP-dependent DNA helicase RecG n=1 Tax=Clostridium mobile TaxID=2841512 RepID=A0ABS6EE91_9CLOT|nr:ATP-dependent DNA helicase RecG [Clostridium mobile]MBU5482739.1 ATP-dependent DNA helicase RecG [Clostridium mobile]